MNNLFGHRIFTGNVGACNLILKQTVSCNLWVRFGFLRLHSKKEKHKMPNIITIGKRLIPLDDIALVEPFEPREIPGFRPPGLFGRALSWSTAKAFLSSKRRRSSPKRMAFAGLRPTKPRSIPR
jgi:hypothetical protein